MTTSKNLSAADNEHLYLKRNALLSFALGLLFIVEILEVFFSSAAERYYWLDISLNSLAAVVSLLIIFMLIKISNGVGGLSKSALWYGDFQDEYVNFLNLKAYKWTFNLTCGVLFFIFIFDDVTSAFSDNISIAEFARFVIGVIFISYSLPIGYLLYKDNENECCS